jgi:hypothetical protein
MNVDVFDAFWKPQKPQDAMMRLWHGPELNSSERR